MGSKDYARRPELIGDMSHVEWMKRPTFRALQRIREQKESEFKKPYREDDHVPMEHWADYPFPVYTFPPFPNFPGPVPGPDSPWVLHPGEREEEVIDTGCPPTCYCHPGNPTTIAQGGTAMLNVTACAPPNEMTVAIHEDNYFNVRSQPAFIRGSGAQWVFTIEAEDDACGMCTMIISCSDGSGTICYLRCDTGNWVQKGQCTSSGNPLCYVVGGCPNGSPFSYIVGLDKWTFIQDTQCLKGANASTWEEPGGEWYCAGHEPPTVYNTPYKACGGQDTPCATSGGVDCYFRMRFAYHYEWECE